MVWNIQWFLNWNIFLIEKIDITIVIKYENVNILFIQIYIGDIIFNTINEKICQIFAWSMPEEFEINMIGKFTFLNELQIKQKKCETLLINQIILENY